MQHWCGSLLDGSATADADDDQRKEERSLKDVKAKQVRVEIGNMLLEFLSYQFFTEFQLRGQSGQSG